MNIFALAMGTVERTPIPDSLALAGIDYLAGRTSRRLSTMPPETEAAFARSMKYHAIADPDHAGMQMAEMPDEFAELVLGPQRKYSCCLYPTDTASLSEAETFAIAETIAHANISDGQTILELGCGWGALSLGIARNFPYARITAVTNSTAQRDYIENQIAVNGLSNLTVTTSDIHCLAPATRFDRILSVELFEHVPNWQLLFERMQNWLNADGRLFLHVFAHRNRSYRLDQADSAVWMAHHFLGGSIMPAFDLPHRFSDVFKVEQEWRWSGAQYRRTAMDWLDNFDGNLLKIDAILRRTHGADALLWRRRWRLHFLSLAGLFGHANGEEWGVGHYLLRPARHH